METEKLSELSSSELELTHLIERETFEPTLSWSKRMRGALIALPFAGVIACLFHLGWRSNQPFISAMLDGGATELHPAWVNDCGGYDLRKLNDFSSFDAMITAGWVFSSRGGHWNPNTKYKPALAGIGMQPPFSSYWGYDYPGNGVIRLRLHGWGEVRLDVGNAFHQGMVEIGFDHIGTFATVPANTLSKIVKHEFREGYNLTILEDKPRGIVVINHISFACPEGAGLRQKKHLQYVAGASWDIENVNCADYTVVGSVDAQPWDAATAISDRTWCADSCLEVRDDCDGFLYPDPGDGESKCRQIKKTAAGEVRNICNLDLSMWAVHVFEEKNPADYPAVIKDTQ